MTSFVLAAAALTLLAIAFVVVPVLRSRRQMPDLAPANEASNLALARAQRDEVLRDHAAGLISDAEKEEALAEIAHRLAQDLEGADLAGSAIATPAATVQPIGGGVKTLIAVLVVAIPVASGLLYWKWGTPDALNPPPPPPVAEPGAADQQILAMVDSLTEKMKTRPDDAQGWSLLARSQAAIGRFEGAARSYERLNQLKPNDPDILADYAEVIAMTQQESFEGKPWELVQQALRLNPDQRKALAIAGTAELRRRNLPQALGHWERLLKLLPPDSEDARQVSSAILEVRLAMTGNAGTVAARPGGANPPARPGSAPTTAPSPAAAAPAKPAPSPAASSGAERVAGTVTMSAEMIKNVSPGDTLFIFARAAGPNAPRMPLAIIRASVSDLPKTFELTDGMAMAPNLKLSDFPQVTIEARVSKAGSAMSQPGDLIGASAPVKPGTSGIKVVIDRVVK